MDFARRFVNADNEWSNRSLAQLSLQYTYSDLFAATDGFHEKNKVCPSLGFIICISFFLDRNWELWCSIQGRYG